MTSRRAPTRLVTVGATAGNEGQMSGFTSDTARTVASTFLGKVIGTAAFLVLGIPLAAMLADLVGQLPNWVDAVQSFVAPHQAWATLIAVAAFACWGLVMSFSWGAAVFAFLGWPFGASVAGWATGDPLWEATLGCAVPVVIALILTRQQLREYKEWRRVSHVRLPPPTEEALRRRHAEAFAKSVPLRRFDADASNFRRPYVPRDRARPS